MHRSRELIEVDLDALLLDGNRLEQAVRCDPRIIRVESFEPELNRDDWKSAWRELVSIPAMKAAG